MSFGSPPPGQPPGQPPAGQPPPGQPPAGWPPGGYGPPPGGAQPGGWGTPAGGAQPGPGYQSPPGWGAAPPPGAPPGGYGVPQQAAGGQLVYYPPEDVESGKTWAILGYVISPLWIIPIIQRDNAFAVYHAKQALALFIASVVAWIPIGIIAFVTCGIGAILGLVFLYPWIMGIIYAINGEYKPLPWVSWIADNYLQGIQADQRPQQRQGYYR